MGTLHALIQMNVVEKVISQISLAFFNGLFLGPKSNKLRPIIDLSSLNTFLKYDTFKTETPEYLRTSLQTGKWVTSVDFEDAYFNISINPQSRKYLRFHVHGQSYHFKVCSLSTTPMEFMTEVKEVKLMAENKDTRIHKYLDECLVRATYHQT